MRLLVCGRGPLTFVWILLFIPGNHPVHAQVMTPTMLHPDLSVRTVISGLKYAHRSRIPGRQRFPCPGKKHRQSRGARPIWYVGDQTAWVLSIGSCELEAEAVLNSGSAMGGPRWRATQVRSLR